MSTKHILINGDSRHMSLIPKESVHLIVTSPPYWQLKDYGNNRQIGFNDTYEQYINSLNLVWQECYRILQSGCRLCINIGDQFARTAYYGRYKVVPIHSEIIRFCETIGFDFMGSIVWQKPTTMITTGGSKVMGSYPYPRGGIVKIDYEYILLFKKQGKSVPPTSQQRAASVLTDEEWNTFFSSHWNFPGARQDRHIAIFPEELPRRLIKMYSFAGDIVCDPFMGSGTTALAAMNLQRNSVGYEINQDFRLFYKEKVIAADKGCNNTFEFSVDTSSFDYSSAIQQLPYTFVDFSRLERQENAIPIGRVTFSNDIQEELAYSKAMVLVNHAKADVRLKMIETGICYLRAGESKGSLLVEDGFQYLTYVLLHTSGEEMSLYKLKTQGHFQIWTKETLEQYGFHPQHASYYVVLRFDNKKPISISKKPEINEGMNTYRAKIRSLADFVSPQEFVVLEGKRHRKN